MEKYRLRGCVGKVGACARNGVAHNDRGVVCRGEGRSNRLRSTSGGETGRRIQPGGAESGSLVGVEEVRDGHFRMRSVYQNQRGSHSPPVTSVVETLNEMVAVPVGTTLMENITKLVLRDCTEVCQWSILDHAAAAPTHSASRVIGCGGVTLGMDFFPSRVGKYRPSTKESTARIGETRLS